MLLLDVADKTDHAVPWAHKTWPRTMGWEAGWVTTDNPYDGQAINHDLTSLFPSS
jgi:hypothetical protein